MSACQIFEVMDAARTVSNEIERLIPDILAGLKAVGLQKDSKFTWDKETAEGDELEWVEVGATVLTDLAIPARKAHLPRSRTLSLRFDLWRNEAEPKSKWAHSHQSLLVIAYASESGDNWSSSNLAITAEGRLSDPETWENCGTHRFFDTRLLEWHEERKGKNWYDRSWVFGVPLHLISSLSEIEIRVVQPINALLTGGDVSQSLQRAGAIKWGQP